MSDAKIEHLKFIQETVKRMAGNSFLLKGWTVTLVTGVFAVAVKRSDGGLDLNVAKLAWLPLLAFGALDTYYLWVEQRFRKLYDLVRTGPGKNFSMNVTEVPRKDRPAFLGTLLSVSIWPFYGALILVLAVMTHKG